MSIRPVLRDWGKTEGPTVTEECTSFLIKTDSGTSTALIPIDPQYIPEGFEIDEEFHNPTFHLITYLNEDGQYIEFCQKLITDGLTAIDTEDVEIQKLHIAGTEVVSVSDETIIQLFWHNDSCIFSIIGNADRQDMLLFVEKIIDADK